MGKKEIIPLLLMLVFLCGCGKAEKYEQAKAFMDGEQYSEAIAIFSELGDFEDSQDLIAECNELIEQQRKYEEADSLLTQKQYEEAAAAFASLGNYKDCNEKRQEALFQEASEYINTDKILEKDYSPERDKLFELLSSLGDYKDSATILKDLQYDRALYCIQKKNIRTAAEAVEALGNYNDLYALYGQFIEENTYEALDDSLVKKDDSRKKSQLNTILNSISSPLAFAKTNYYRAIYDYATELMAKEDYENASQWFYYVSKYDYSDSKEMYEEAKKFQREELNVVAEKIAKEKEEQERIRKEKEEQGRLARERAAQEQIARELEWQAAMQSSTTGTESGGPEDPKVKEETISTASLSMNEIGQTYIDNNGLSVILNSYTASESEGYISYTIKYTITNNVPDSKILPGSFKLFFTDNTGESQYGVFNYLFCGESDSRTYTWKVLKSQTILTLEYNANDDNAGLDGAFFRNKPKASAMHWATP